MWGDRRTGRFGPSGAVHPDAQRRTFADVHRFDSAEQLKVWREMDRADEAPVVIYHSHTATEAYPSRTDISYAGEPGATTCSSPPRDPQGEGGPQLPHRRRCGHREPVEIVPRSLRVRPSSAPDIRRPHGCDRVHPHHPSPAHRR